MVCPNTTLKFLALEYSYFIVFGLLISISGLLQTIQFSVIFLWLSLITREKKWPNSVINGITNMALDGTAFMQIPISPRDCCRCLHPLNLHHSVSADDLTVE